MDPGAIAQVAVPALGEWGLFLAAGILAAAGLFSLMRKAKYR